MAYRGLDWTKHGFGAPPFLKVSPAGGLLLYRCWGARSPCIGSTEWGTGYFALEKPASVLDAERKANIVGWGSGVHFVSTFRLRAGTPYWVGKVAHGRRDEAIPAQQVFVEPPLEAKLVLERSRELLTHDVVVGPRDGRA